MRSQKNNCDIPKLLRRAWRCDVRMADEQTCSIKLQACRDFPISTNNFNGRREDINTVLRLRFWPCESSNNNALAKLSFSDFICSNEEYVHMNILLQYHYNITYILCGCRQYVSSLYIYIYYIEGNEQSPTILFVGTKE